MWFDALSIKDCMSIYCDHITDPLLLVCFYGGFFSSNSFVNTKRFNLLGFTMLWATVFTQSFNSSSVLPNLIAEACKSTEDQVQCCTLINVSHVTLEFVRCGTRSFSLVYCNNVMQPER